MMATPRVSVSNLARTLPLLLRMGGGNQLIFNNFLAVCMIFHDGLPYAK